MLNSREELDQAAKDLEAKYSDGSKVARPPYWTGYRIVPAIIEFWQVRGPHPTDIYLLSEDASDNIVAHALRRGVHLACMIAWPSPGKAERGL